MPRFKPYSYDQSKLIPVSFQSQLHPGTFEFALSHIVDDLDLSVFLDRYRNDEEGAPAYDPAILLKIVLFAYSRGMVSSREIERACRENVVFMALSADSRPHFTTIADFISSMDREIAPLFLNVLAVCAQEGLIGKQMFAVDGCKISSNCAKEWSGTRTDFEKKKAKLEASIELLLRKHRETDTSEASLPPSMRDDEAKAIERLRAKVRKVEGWLSGNEDRRGRRGNVVKSNVTDNESAKMPSAHGVIQGYNGVAAVDDKHQVIVHAEAFGEGQEHQLLKPMVEGIRENLSGIGVGEEAAKAVLVADSGFHSEENMKMVLEEEIDGYIADNRFRKRDPVFETAVRHKKRIDRHKCKKAGISSSRYFEVKDFRYDGSKGKLICPAGKELYVKNRNFVERKGFRGIAYMAKITDCRACGLRSKCLRHENTVARQVTVFRGRGEAAQSFTQRMIERFDTPLGRFLYSRRMGIVEPVFANVCHTLGLNRFTLRGKTKVGIQWKLYCMVHNLGKVFRYSPRFA